MRYTLEGQVVVSPGHDKDRPYKFLETFDIDLIEQAIMVARAMVQSQQLKRKADGIIGLNARLTNARHDTIWSTEFVHAVTKAETVVVTPEHFKETVHES